MNGYSKIRHTSLDPQSERNPAFSHNTPDPESPALSYFKYKQWRSDHGDATFRRSRSTACHMIDEEEQRHAIGFQAKVWRAFSLRREASFMDNGYCRIRDRRDVFLAEEEGEEEAHRAMERHRRKGSRRKGFVGLCKKLVGF